MVETNLLRLICVFVGFAVLYLCFSDTWIHVVVKTNLLRLICVFAGFAVVYLCFSDIWVHVVVETSLPVFGRYLGTCCDQKGFV